MRLKNTVDIMVIKTITIEDLKTQKFHKEMKMLMMDIQSSLMNKMMTKLLKTSNYLKTKYLKQ